MPNDSSVTCKFWVNNQVVDSGSYRKIASPSVCLVIGFKLSWCSNNSSTPALSSYNCTSAFEKAEIIMSFERGDFIYCPFLQPILHVWMKLNCLVYAYRSAWLPVSSSPLVLPGVQDGWVCRWPIFLRQSVHNTDENEASHNVRHHGMYMGILRKHRAYYLNNIHVSLTLYAIAAPSVASLEKLVNALADEL